jgi:hypothetical protein
MLKAALVLTSIEIMVWAFSVLASRFGTALALLPINNKTKTFRRFFKKESFSMMSEKDSFFAPGFLP